MAKWELEYTEAYRQFRQIDTRIWGIYALYVTAVVAASGYLAKLWKDDSEDLVVIFLGLILISAVTVAQFALVGHLQWYSDILADRIREIEGFHGMAVGGLFAPADESVARLWGPHRWLMKLRARDVMQMLGLLVLLGCVIGGIVIGHQALGYKWGISASTDVILVICGTVAILAFLFAFVVLKLSEHRLQSVRLRLGTGKNTRREGGLGEGAAILTSSVLLLGIAIVLVGGMLFLRFYQERLLILLGLGLEVAGVGWLIRGELRVQGARIRHEAEAGRKIARTRMQRLPVWLAEKVGSPNVSDTQESVVESLTGRFWGLMLLAFGFILQVLGIVCGWNNP